MTGNLFDENPYDYGLTSRGIVEMVKERGKQILKGYTPVHDAEHEPEHLVAAGLCYIEHALFALTSMSGDSPPFNWPWAAEEWKPHDDVMTDLTVGGALVAAGWDRYEQAITEGLEHD